MTRTRWAVFAVLGVPLPVCMHALGCVDLSNLDVPVADGSTLDSSPSGDAAVADADGGEPQDAGDPDAAYCERNAGHDHCFDFDRVGTPSLGWTNEATSGGPGGGAVALDRAQFRSPPASMRSSVESGITVGGTYAREVLTVTPHPTRVSLAFDIAREASPDGGTYDGAAGLVGLQESDGTDIYSVGFNVAGNAYHVRVDYPGDAGWASETFATGELSSSGWTRVELVVTYASPWNVRLSFDGVPQLDRAFPARVAVASPSLGIGVGLIATSGGPFAVRYDNVLIDVD